MATEIIRHMSFFYKSRKVAYAQNVQYDINPNKEDQLADEGWIGVSSGPAMVKISVDAIVPVKGMQLSIVEDMLNNKYVDVSLGPCDGKIHQNTVQVMNASYTSDATNGTLKGKFDFSGGKPKIVG